MVGANVTLAHGTSGKGKASSLASQEQTKLLTRIESFVTETLSRSVRPAGEEESALARDLAIRVMAAISKGSLLAEHEVGVSVLMRAANCVWFCVKVVRSCKVTAKVNEAALKDTFNELVSVALESSTEFNWRILRGFVMTWAAFDLSFVLPGISKNATALNCLISNHSGLRVFQRRQLLEMLTSAIKRAASFGMKEVVCSLLNSLPSAFSPLYLSSEADLSASKVDFMREDLKFIQMAAKKHAELDSQAGKITWETILSKVPRVMEAHLLAKGDQSAATKSFLGQLKNC